MICDGFIKETYFLRVFRAVFLKLYYVHKSPGDLVKSVGSYPAGVGWDLRFYLSQKLPGVAHAADSWATKKDGFRVSSTHPLSSALVLNIFRTRILFRVLQKL